MCICHTIKPNTLASLLGLIWTPDLDFGAYMVNMECIIDPEIAWLTTLQASPSC